MLEKKKKIGTCEILYLFYLFVLLAVTKLKYSVNNEIEEYVVIRNKFIYNEVRPKIQLMLEKVCGRSSR